MAKYRVQGPDGAVHVFEGPDGATPEQVTAFASQTFAPKQSKAAAETAAWDAKIKGELTGNMSGMGKFVAGYGKAIPDMVQGIGQRLGMVSQADVDERKRLDAPLMATSGGMAGNITGNVAAALPSVAIPAASTILGAGAIGAGLGFAQPTATGESALHNAGVGAAFGGVGTAAGKLIGAGYRGVKALAEPFTAAGPQRIAGRTLERFAENPNSIANVTNRPTATGALPTLAEQTGDRGLATLQDALASADPQLKNALAGRAMDNNSARVNALRQMAGEDGGRDFAIANRAGTAQQLYGDAFNVAADSSMSAENSRAIQALMKSPAIRAAANDARAIAANRGANIGPSNASGSVEGLHNMKMALDDAIQTATAAGQGNKASSIKEAQKKLVGLIEQISPDYRAARTTYADMSRPINQMDVAAQLARRGLSNGSDLSGTPTINRNALLGAMRDEPALIRQATGRSGAGNALADVMEPEQMQMLNSIRSEVDRAGAVATAGNGAGSATAQRLASQNILRQVVNPNGQTTGGLSQRVAASLAENTLANTVVGKATNWLYSGIAEPRIQQALARAILSPEDAQAAISAARQQGITLPDNLMTRLVGQARRLTGVSTSNATRQP